MLVAFPVGLLLTSVVFDGLAYVMAGPGLRLTAYWMLAAGIVGGLVAAPFGLIDLMAIPDRTRASRVGAWHGVFNLVVLCLSISSWSMRPSGEVSPPTLALVLSLAGAGLVLMTAWMGGELVSRLGIGVSVHANPDASSSMRGPVDVTVEAEPRSPSRP
jgi:uncharacterized membrane protein